MQDIAYQPIPMNIYSMALSTSADLCLVPFLYRVFNLLFFIECLTVYVQSIFVCRRLDYFVVSERLVKDVTDCIIRKEVYGSDHCPLVLGLASPTTPTPPSP